MAKTDTLDAAALQADLGNAWGVGLIMSVPELMVLAYRSQGWENARWNRRKKKIVIGKKTEGVEWDATRIQMEIQNSKWYASRDGSARLAANAEQSDPATWQRNVADIANTLQRKATEMGADLSKVDIPDLAQRILRENYLYVDRSPDGTIPESILNGFLVPYIRQGKDGNFSGQAGMSAADIRATLREYGVMMTDQWVLRQVQGLQDGTRTEQDILNEVVGVAKQTWGPMANGISDTVSTKMIASPYLATMAAVLELDENAIGLDTPEIKNALMFTDPATGQVRQKSQWEFEQELRRDPRWEGTKQGQKELGDASMQMLRDFGFWK